MIDGMIVDKGTVFDGSDSMFPKQRDTKIDGRKCVKQIQAEHDKTVTDQVTSMNDLVILTQRDGQQYNIH